MDKLVCLKDFEAAALTKLEARTGEYYRGGADDEVTASENRNAYQSWKIRPRLMRDVSTRNLSCTVLGKRVEFPIGISPTAYQRVAHPNGETATAKAAEKLGTIFTFSMFATSSYEEIAEAAPSSRRWFQVFLFKDRDFMTALVERAEKAGFEAIVVTLDGQYFGTRRACLRKPFEFPAHLRLKNVFPDRGDLTYDKIIGLHEYMAPGPTWDDIKWLKSVTKLPIVVKGVMTGEDALLAAEVGCDAVWVSNHGGRQLDTLMATIDVLPEVVAAVKGKCEVYVDGGVNLGTDVFKALALGANMVFAGRAIIWGLAVDGEAGVRRVLEILRNELDLAMALSGTRSIKDITREFVRHPQKDHRDLFPLAFSPPPTPTSTPVCSTCSHNRSILEKKNSNTERYVPMRG